ncbi:uromodulin-like [Engystomops pustulosus]|uniref:uromodulin-like n=1 Tax=Engystomops pustulosus TaxID=76066 RepID=UPI003AFB4059
MHQVFLFLTLVSIASAFGDSTIGPSYVTSPNPLCSYPTTSSSLTYLVDTTGSMGNYLSQLKLVNSWILDRVTARFPCGVRQYTMVEYNDPDVGPVRYTQSKQNFGNYFNTLSASGGGDCPELTMKGLELALINSPPKSYILVFTDASAADYGNTTLVNNVRSLINTTKSQVIFLVTGYCNTTNTPDFSIYRDIAALSFGHVYLFSISDINKVFNYLDYTLSMPSNSSTQLFSGEFTALTHNESFSITKNFSSMMITTSGLVYSVQVSGPNLVSMDKLVLEVWGFVLLIKRPTRGNWALNVTAGGIHSVRVEGLTAFNTTSSCSKCHVNATCEDYYGSLQCLCKSGFIGDGIDCTDIDECAYSWTNNCSVGVCSNNIGSYTCKCPSGFYSPTPYSCVDINECLNSSLSRCHPLATCLNTNGNYSCSCPYGYFGDGFNCEVNDCSRGVCAAGKECVKTSGSYLCLDPCSSYIALNESWRSSLNYVPSSYAIYSDYKCDNYLNGWYRFIGSGGVRMPESCISSFYCGTHAPMWLNGVHPTTSDGIVNRTACATWSGSCCLWSSNIQIKACPGGYHVYKIYGTPACTLAYCTDPNTNNATCEADEEWKLGSQGYGCYCKSQYTVSSLADMRPELTCGTNEMKASFHKCQAKALNFDLNSFKSNACFQFQDDRFTNTFSILSRLEAGNCGLQSYQNSTHVTYVSKLFITSEASGIITRNESLTVSMSCSYPLDMQITLSQALMAIVKSVVVSVGGTGQFTVSMALFTDSSYKYPYTGSQVLLSVKDTLYIGAYIQGGDNSTFVVLMKNCYATPSSDPNDPVKHYIIKDSCPNKQDSSISVPQNGVSREGRLQVQMFKFVGDAYDSVYLHCALGLCNTVTGSCVPTCSGGRSAGVDVETRDVTLGPIVRTAVSSHVPISASASSIIYIPALLLMVFSMFL